MPDLSPYCCCPGCGECSAHRNEPKRKARIKELERDLAAARAEADLQKRMRELGWSHATCAVCGAELSAKYQGDLASARADLSEALAVLREAQGIVSDHEDLWTKTNPLTQRIDALLAKERA